VSAIRDVRLEQRDAHNWSDGEWADIWSDGARLFEFLESNTNNVAAARAFPWDRVLKPDATVLDLGCGAGWLSALLSRDERVRRVIAWDSSASLLTDRLPEVVAHLDARMDRIERVCGDFTPLMLDDDSVDLAVMVSAFHHADAPGELLSDLCRVLRPGGAIVLMDELIWPRSWTALHMLRTFAGAALTTFTPRARIKAPGHVTSTHILYDDALGDRAFTAAQWRVVLSGHGLQGELLDSGLPPYKPQYRRRGHFQGNLVHWILRPR
jgi:SAM-dependent methyltransferase